MPTPPLSDDLAAEALDFVAQHGSITAAALAMGIPRATLQTRVTVARSRGLHLSDGAREIVSVAKLGYIEAKGGWIHSHDADGKKIGATRWQATQAPLDDDALARIADRMQRVIPVPAIVRPKALRSDVLNFIPVYDVHLGQRIGSFGTANAVERLRAGFRDVLDRAPQAETTIILNGGDFTEANDNSALTPQHKNPLAVDMDFDDISDIAVDLTIELIEYALRKSGRVVYQPLKGNHDPATAVSIRSGLRQRYRDNKRFELKDGFDLFTHEWRGNLIAGIHGDAKTTKPETLALAIASRHPSAWGAAKRRDLWRGHRHNAAAVSVPGMRVIQVNAICPPGRYANDNLFTSDSDIQAVSYHAGGARVGNELFTFDRIAP